MRQEAHEILYNPRLNKGTAFSEAERELLGLTGLFPDAVEDSATQQRRALMQLSMRANNLERYVFLSELQDRNERLFYQLLRADPARHMPIVYTPTVGEACPQFGHILRRPKGLYVSRRHRGDHPRAAPRQARGALRGQPQGPPAAGHLRSADGPGAGAPRRRPGRG